VEEGRGFGDEDLIARVGAVVGSDWREVGMRVIY
jgi:hypothetical protein